jgi:hypothetical protein
VDREVRYYGAWNTEKGSRLFGILATLALLSGAIAAAGLAALAVLALAARVRRSEARVVAVAIGGSVAFLALSIVLLALRPEMLEFSRPSGVAFWVSATEIRRLEPGIGAALAIAGGALGASGVAWLRRRHPRASEGGGDTPG